MAGLKSITVPLTPEMAKLLYEAVESGEYVSPLEVIRDALDEWGHRHAERMRANEDLGRLWDEGIESGRSEDGERVFAKLRERIAGEQTATTESE